MSEEQPIYEDEDESVLQSLENAAKERKQRELREYIAGKNEDELPIEDRKTDVLSSSGLEKRLGEEDLPIEDKKTVVLEPEELESRLEDKAPKPTEKLDKKEDHKYIRLTIPNFFARPAGEDYREVTRALFLDQDAYLRKVEECEGIKDARLNFEVVDLRRDLEQLTGFASLVSDEYESDFVVIYEVGSIPLDFEDLALFAPDNTIYCTLVKKGCMDYVVRSEQGKMVTLAEVRALTFRTNNMSFDALEKFRQFVAGKDWSPRDLAGYFDFYSLLCQGENKDKSINDIVNGNIGKTTIPKKGVGYYTGSLTAKKDGLLEPVITALLGSVPNVGYRDFTYQ